MVLCFRSKFTKKLNIKLLSKGFALKSVVFKLDQKIVKFSLKDILFIYNFELIQLIQKQKYFTNFKKSFIF